jgi:hypothetical protein
LDHRVKIFSFFFIFFLTFLHFHSFFSFFPHLFFLLNALSYCCFIVLLCLMLPRVAALSPCPTTLSFLIYFVFYSGFIFLTLLVCLFRNVNFFCLFICKISINPNYFFLKHYHYTFL